MISNHLVMPIALRRRAFAGTGAGGDQRPHDLSGVVLGIRRDRHRRRHPPRLRLLSGGRRCGARLDRPPRPSPPWRRSRRRSSAASSGRRGTALGASAGLVAGFLTWAYTLLLPSLIREGVLFTDLIAAGPFGIAALKPTALFGFEASPAHPRRRLEPEPQHPRLRRILPVEARDGARTAAGQCLRRWTSPVDRAELPPVPRQRLRRRPAQHRRALSRRRADQAVVPELCAQPRPGAGRATPRPTSTFCATPSTLSPRPSAPPPRGSRFPCCCAAATSRRRHALKLLDDASAAIQYSRDLLQHAIDHASQGITVLDRDLHLLGWNRAFVDLYDLPPDLIRIGVGLEEIVRFNAARGAYGRGAARGDGHDAPARLRARPGAGAIAAAPFRQGAGDPLEPAARRWLRDDLHRRHRGGGGGGGAGARQRDPGAARPRAHRGADRAQRSSLPGQGRSRRSQHLEDPLSRRGKRTTSSSPSTRRVSTPPRSSNATAKPATRRLPRTSMPRSTRWKRSSPPSSTSPASTPAP